MMLETARPESSRYTVGYESVDSFWRGGRRVLHVLRRACLVSQADRGRFVVSVQLREDSSHERFMTPSTNTDKMFWPNGLDGVESFAASFATFGGYAEAVTAVQRFRWHKATFFVCDLDDSHRRLLLREVGRCLWPCSEVSTATPAAAAIALA